MLRFPSLILLMNLICFAASSQQVSQMQLDAQRYSAFGSRSDFYWDSLRIADGAPVTSQANVQPQMVCNLEKRVFGWHPYWVGTVYNNYQWNLLSDLCYFDYAVSPTTGNNTNASYAWSTSAAVTAAINNGVDVHICATLFGSHSTFLSNSTAQQTFINNMISQLQARGGKGVNIDFEGMGSANTAAFTAFMQNFSNQLHAAIPGSELSVALYAVDWSNTFDIPALTPYVDLFIIMGYDYYWSGSTTAGPEDPLYNYETSYNRTLTRSITFYLAQGMPASKLLLGLPYYGREWETVSGTVPSATTGNYTATKTYSVVRNNANGYWSNEQWEANSFSPYYPYQISSAWRQLWCDNAYSMRSRFDVVNQRNLGGIGIWALGYDDGYNDYWNAISDKFSDCAVVPCSDTIWDMGGPYRNYYDNEFYTTTLAPDGATSVSLTFTQFSTEVNYDTLYIYDGPNSSSPLIGQWHGTSNPGTVVSTGPSISFRFSSDGSTVAPGFTAIWSCSIDNTNPTTQINAPSGWITQNFNTTFSDNDQGSGVEKSYYQTAHYNGTEWRSNTSRGFLNDDFSGAAIHPEWSNYSGNWNINAGTLEQSDENNTNTCLSAPLTQNLSNRYLYHWKGKISGTGNNRRAGLHYFCSDDSLINRGNGYFVWFRADQSQLQFYEVINDTFYLRSTVSDSININQWYDWKVIYDRITGITEVYQDDEFVGSWTDVTPYSNGDYVSLRSGNCNWQVDSFHVYRSRFTNGTVNISVGNCSGCDFRNENPAPNVSAGMIRSVVRDSARLFSSVEESYSDVDWTAPVNGSVFDGSTSDIDTTWNLTLIEGNWMNAADSNSGVVAYYYAIGTTPGDSDFVAWTNNGSATAFSNPVTLIAGQWYYISLRAENGAGLISVTDSSDGQVADLGLNIAEQSVRWRCYPNPAVNAIYLDGAGVKPDWVRISDVAGRIVPFKQESAQGQLRIDLSGLASGEYLLQVCSGGKISVMKFIKE
jgi:spore germination protein YaaH